MTDRSTTEWSDYHPDKERLRSKIWSQLKQQGAVRRDPVGHIPNFIGAEQAAAQLAALPIWQQATVIKCNPDAPQTAVRSQALREGKRLYMAVPRLTQTRCFVEMTATDLQQRQIRLEDAAVARQALQVGRSVRFEEMEPIDLVVVGCVAVTRSGGRTGKGAGFADLELAMLQQFELIQPETAIVTTVHPLQIVPPEQLPMQAHDWALNWIVTPEEAIATQPEHPRPTGLDWAAIRPEQYAKIPILRQLRSQAGI